MKEVKRIDSFWHFSCGDVLCHTWFPVVVVRHWDMFRTLSEASLWRALHWRGCCWSAVPQRGCFKIQMITMSIIVIRTQWPQQRQFLWPLLVLTQPWQPQSVGRPGASAPTPPGSPTWPLPLESSLPSCSSSISSSAGECILSGLPYLSDTYDSSTSFWYITDAWHHI